MTEPSSAAFLSLPPGRFVDLSRPVTIDFEGRRIPAFAGQSIGAALYAGGIRTFTRSFKYHRPRGLFCVSGDCPNCLMQVDGQPNVRTCVEPVRDGQSVCHQNAWPSLRFDALRIFDHLDFLLPVGFYYKHFHKPRWIWPLFERAVRNIAGLGRIDIHAVPAGDAEVEHLHTEVCVIGGGPAGLAAAAEAAQGGANVLLLERWPQPGGHLLIDEWNSDTRLNELLAAVRRQERIEVRTDATAFGLYEGNLIGAFQADRLLKIRAQQIIICTGTRQRPLVFPNNDLPGVFLSDAVLRLGRLQGVRAGRRAVIVADRAEGLGRLPDQLRRLGIEIAAEIDLRQSGVALQALGRSRLRAVRLCQVDANGRPKAGSAWKMACDLLCVASERVPANELCLQAGMRFRGDVPLNKVPGISWRTTNVNGRDKPASQLTHRGGKRFICLCEDVTEKDLAQAVAEGFDHIETLKRYSTVSMGPCQGKMCGLNAMEACARLTNKDPNVVGLTTSRPPAIPVELCVLAADRQHHPVRRTPMHHWHQSAGAKWMDAGQWKRPEHYGEPLAEVRAVRTKAGLIDVSTLGKIEVIGPDAATLLERVYLNRWADLKEGRARYGAMCTEEGILFDDGVAARTLARGASEGHRYYLTATTGNAEAVFEWLELWRTTWRLEVTLVNCTSANAAMNLAGPESRQILATLTSLDISPSAFPYMSFREADVADVPCRLLRIGFVGELGYEIHCPAAAGMQLWEAILQAGKEFGLVPFGVEAQRVLRLEKGHLLFGVDTDALSNPLEAGLEWLVRFEKPEFIGREPLVKFKNRGPRSRLVGFYLTAPPSADTDFLSFEGCQVVEGGRPVGRVTSMRFSPTLERPLGLAWLPAAKSQAGAQFFIRWNERDIAAKVVPLPFYDPEMKRLKG
ncbi:MAG TPA: 2Fe-2S iron-sulfur cluster-binding protein [Gemmataceae bacterium]|jgi:sarcosine oxidase subunit alpha|nr:2Fe-2S iron-sulfur cluster-binding protein [Gemmataceae bacterium]